MIDGNWLSVQRDDPRAFAFYRRHYSSGKQMKSFRDVYRDVAWEAWREALSSEALNVAVGGGQTILAPLDRHKN